MFCVGGRIALTSHVFGNREHPEVFVHAFAKVRRLANTRSYSRPNIQQMRAPTNQLVST